MRPFDPELAASYPAVIGCDEVGRGALCGPVVVAAVWFDPNAVSAEMLGNLDDSKKLTARQRERLFDMVMASAKVAVAANSAARIDRYGIRATTLEAMRLAVKRLAIKAPARFDGRDVPDNMDVEAKAQVRAESSVPQVAAASVVAKVFRDRLMARLASRYPEFLWDKNVGYGTAWHLAALQQHGPTPHHRRSFAPVGR